MPDRNEPQFALAKQAEQCHILKNFHVFQPVYRFTTFKPEDIPLIKKNLDAFQVFPDEPAQIDARWKIARGIIAVVLLLFAAMQITLTFHSESLAKAFHDHLRFLRGHWWSFGWFLVVAAMHFYLTLVFLNLVQLGLGDGTSLGIAWGLLTPWVNGFVAAWLLASWVCYYKHGDAVHTPPPQSAMEQGVLF